MTDDQDFPGPDGNVALVTGAARRIGRAIATDLGRNGWRVGVHYSTSLAEANEVVADIQEAGGEAIAVAADLGREAEVRALVQQVAAQFGPMSLLVNNASVFEHDGIEDVTRSSWDAHFDVNLFAPTLLMQMLADGLPDGVEGNVVNIIDQRVWRLTPRFLSYTLSKSGLWTLTRTMAMALAPNIRVNAIGPGPTLRNERQAPEHFARQSAATILGRGPTLDEIADAVRFIIRTRSMTGQMIALDGGQHLAWETPDIRDVPE